MARISQLLCALLLLVLVSCSKAQEGPFESDLERLDEAIGRAEDYVRLKEQKISTIENLLRSRGVSPLQQYGIYGELFNEYAAFQFDKAKEALDNQVRLARGMGEKELEDGALIEKARLLTTAGYYHEAELLFARLDTNALNPAQKVSWYMARQKFLYDYNEYVSGSGFEVPDVERISYYQDKILESLPKESFYRRHVQVQRLFADGDLDAASQLNLSLISTLDKSSRDYALQTYWQGLICDTRRETAKAIHWWTESAVCDIKGAIKDNASLSTIAIKLPSPKYTDRAFRYIRFSFDDASFYNAKLRRVQVATSFPMIEKAYTTSKVRHETEREKFLLIISSIAVLLVIISFLTVWMYMKEKKALRSVARKNEQTLQYMRSMEEARESLRRTNLDLAEANAAKEEYLGLFLSMCSGYLDKLKKSLSREQYESELRNFYKTFDTSFLQLYPGFVGEFNSLLREESRLVPKEGELLNTELRIFALIKLGITQSSHIASLLRYSVNTIYNYRAQVKNAVREDRENFEDLVRKIGSKG